MYSGASFACSLHIMHPGFAEIAIEQAGSRDAAFSSSYWVKRMIARMLLDWKVCFPPLQDIISHQVCVLGKTTITVSLHV